MFNFLTDDSSVNAAAGLDRNVSAPSWHGLIGSDFVFIIRDDS